MLENIKNYVLSKMFVVSKQPVLFKDLLEANSLYNEGMLIDPAKLNFKFKYDSLYIIYALFLILVLILLIICSHRILEKVDFHFSIILTALVTSLCFIFFDMFKRWARKEISIRLIKKAWNLHFPYFAYDKYSQKIDEIYNKSLKDEVSKKDLEKYVLDKLIKSAN